MIRYGPEVCRDLTEATRREWLETNGIGGFASSTIAGMNTRRYHGLLTAALDPPSDRKVLLSKLEETLVVDGRRYELSCNQYLGAVHPQGHLLQHEFRLDPFPVFVWRVEDLELRKSVFMVNGENTVAVQYHLRAQGSSAKMDCHLEVMPLMAFRDFHATTHANGAINTAVELSEGLTTIKPYGDLPALHFAHDQAEVLPGGNWFYRFQYAREQERGLDFEEDLFQPFTLRFTLATQATIIASTNVHSASECPELRAAELVRRKAAGDGDQFIVERSGGKSVIAGYHWFGDWGRDTMIALPGLTLATGRPEVARDILVGFAKYVSRGMLPNRFPDRGQEPEYNTVDATLWYFEAIRAYIEATGDRADFVDILRDIVAWHRRGTRYGIRMEDDGLLRAGEPGVQLTWMDAKVGDWVVTPRHGKAVEVQALWYNALCILRDLTGEAEYGDLAEHTRQSFETQFWNEENGCLFDVVSASGKDPSIRPNQILAISLPHKILTDRGKAEKILAVVERDLVTPYGLRTLSLRDPQYCSHYTGDRMMRDRAYHQGTVWPWLFGPFLDAYAYVHGKVDVVKWLGPLEEFRADRGAGQIAEIFDPEPPYEPRGCIAQAWSLGELLRIKSRYGATQ